MPPHPLIVLIGPPGAGKSTVGKKVARLLDAPFVDTDSRVAQTHGPIQEIFRTSGENGFRKLERAAVEQALGESAVVSLGGGAILDSQTQLQLGGMPVVLFTVSPEAVAPRISGSKRPLLADASVAERVSAWSALVASRQEIYERVSVASWDTSRRPIAVIAQEVANWVTSDWPKCSDEREDR